MNIILDFLRNDGSIIINKKLIKAIGLNESILYSELLSMFNFYEINNKLTDDRYFFAKIDYIENNTSLSEFQQRKAIKRLKELNLIDCKLAGLPAKRYIKINEDENVLLNILKSKEKQCKDQEVEKLSTSSEKIKELDTEKLDNINIINNKLINNNINNTYICDQDQDIKYQKKVKEGKKTYADNVTMTEKEYQKLIDNHGLEKTKIMIEKLSNYKGSNNKKYSSDYKAILSWVIGWYDEQQNKVKKKDEKKVPDFVKDYVFKDIEVEEFYTLFKN